MATKETVLTTVDDLAGRFLYYDRKEDEELPRGAIQEMIAAGDITMDEIVERFRAALAARLK